MLSHAGLVFFAFAFNMVDCGGLLGGRLGNNVNMHAASLKKAKVGDHTLSSDLLCWRAGRVMFEHSENCTAAAL